MKKPRPAPKSCYVYLLKSCDNGPSKSYVGWTMDLEKRLAAHNDGSGAKATRGRQWQLVHIEVFKTRGEAMSREYELKNDRPARKVLLARGCDGDDGGGGED
ncbi:MAG: GIY-YIG nuclease family protein [PS1 clade bacterium]|nr:GIY-YIG nuclease family protein [PS1 clade bacterium]